MQDRRTPEHRTGDVKDLHPAPVREALTHQQPQVFPERIALSVWGGPVRPSLLSVALVR
jgi:hypothetical protein